MTTLNIYQLIDLSTGAIIPYEPRLASQVAEILDATTHAIEAARLAQCRARLAGLLPATGPRRETGDSLVMSLFALREDN